MYRVHATKPWPKRYLFIRNGHNAIISIFPCLIGKKRLRTNGLKAWSNSPTPKENSQSMGPIQHSCKTHLVCKVLHCFGQNISRSK